jgi:hypothetical protein
MAFNLTKELMLRDGFVLSSLQRGLVEDEGSIQRVLLASDVSELYGVAGQFLGVTVPCKRYQSLVLVSHCLDDFEIASLSLVDFSTAQ